MKALKLIAIAVVLFLANPVQAQVSISLNLGSPPQWGPVGYTHARCYYLPDVEAYYDVQSSMFIYLSGGAWIHRAYLPARYRDYDLYNGYKVVMTDYHGSRPYANFSNYRTKYAKGYRGQAQRSIGARPGKGNSGHEVMQKNNNPGHGNARQMENNKGGKGDNGNGKDRGNGKNNK